MNKLNADVKEIICSTLELWQVELCKKYNLRSNPSMEKGFSIIQKLKAKHYDKKKSMISTSIKEIVKKKLVEIED